MKRAIDGSDRGYRPAAGGCSEKTTPTRPRPIIDLCSDSDDGDRVADPPAGGGAAAAAAAVPSAARPWLDTDSDDSQSLWAAPSAPASASASASAPAPAAAPAAAWPASGSASAAAPAAAASFAPAHTLHCLDNEDNDSQMSEGAPPRAADPTAGPADAHHAVVAAIGDTHGLANRNAFRNVYGADDAWVPLGAPGTLPLDTDLIILCGDIGMEAPGCDGYQHAKGLCCIDVHGKETPYDGFSETRALLRRLYGNYPRAWVAVIAGNHDDLLCRSKTCRSTACGFRLRGLRATCTKLDEAAADENPPVCPQHCARGVSKERLGPLEDVEAALLEGLPRAFILKDEHRVLDLEPIAGVARGRIQVFGSPRTTLDEQTPMVSSSCFSQPENECAAAWNSAVTKYGAAFRAPANGPLVVASHGPALGLWDRVWGKKNVGDLLLRNFLTDVKPALHVCGHVHALQPGEVPTDTGGRGGTRVGYSDEVPGTVLANASSMQAGSKTIKLRWDRKTMGDEAPLIYSYSEQSSGRSWGKPEGCPMLRAPLVLRVPLLEVWFKKVTISITNWW